jgi:hypothetical protein
MIKAETGDKYHIKNVKAKCIIGPVLQKDKAATDCSCHIFLKKRNIIYSIYEIIWVLNLLACTLYFKPCSPMLGSALAWANKSKR